MNNKYSVLSLGLLLACSGPVFAQYSAEQVTPSSAPRLVMQGDVAWGGVKDWHLGNGKVCAIISDPSHESEIAPSGGYLTDLGFCGEAGEAYTNLYFALNLTGSTKPIITKVWAESDKTSASLYSEGEFPGLSFKARYRFDEANGNRLQIVTELSRTSATDVDISALNMVQISKGNKVFAGSMDGRGPAPGFNHPALPKGLWGDLDGLVGSDTVISLPDADDGTAMAYGLHIKRAYLRAADGEQTPLAAFVGVTDAYAAVAAFSQPFWFDSNGPYLDILKLVQSQLLDLPIGETLVFEQEVSVARGRSVASIMNGYWHKLPVVSGHLKEANVPVFLHRLDGGLINQAYTNAQGEFNLHAPAGDYQLLIKAPGRKPISKQFHLSADGYQLAAVDMAGAATLLLPQGQVMRLSFIALDKQVVDFSRQPLGYRTGNRRDAAVRDVMLIGNQHDERSIRLVPGRYRVISSRGPEYSAHAVEINLPADQALQLEIPTPQRSHTTPGYVHADLHTHSAPSFDNSYPQSQRVKSYLAQGGEVLVATEHETIYDMAKDIAKLGLSGQLASVIGTEITGLAATKELPYTIGHANAFPLEVKPYEYRRGQVAHEGKRWREVIGAIKKDDKETVIQLNHPIIYYQAGATPKPHSQQYNEAYFFHLLNGQAFDSSKALASEPNRSLIEPDLNSAYRDIDFDTLELINGTFANLNSYHALRKDWFALLQQGIKIVGTATSDSHGQSRGEVVLEPRTLIAMQDDSIENFKQQEFIQSILAGNLYGSNGPLLELSLSHAGQSRTMGGTLATSKAVLTVKADGADWVEVNRLRVFINGEQITELTINKGQEVLLPLEFEKDSFVIIEVDGPRQGLFADIVPVMSPFAFSNPIYVDANQDGKWQPPGL